VLCAFQTYGQAGTLWGQRPDGRIFGGGCSLLLAGVRDEAGLRRFELLRGRHFLPQVTRSVSRSTRRPVGGFNLWDGVEVQRLPAATAWAQAHGARY